MIEAKVESQAHSITITLDDKDAEALLSILRNHDYSMIPHEADKLMTQIADALEVEI